MSTVVKNINRMGTSGRKQIVPKKIVCRDFKQAKPDLGNIELGLDKDLLDYGIVLK